jgi:hypothetical protein
MKTSQILFAAGVVLTLVGNATYTSLRTRALESRLQMLEIRLQAAEGRVTAANQSPFTFGLAANPPSLGAPAFAPPTVVYTTLAGPAAAANTGDQAGLDLRLRRVEKQLEPHVTLIGGPLEK